jgi:hypothetical protein
MKKVPRHFTGMSREFLYDLGVPSPTYLPLLPSQTPNIPPSHQLLSLRILYNGLIALTVTNMTDSPVPLLKLVLPRFPDDNADTITDDGEPRW